MTDTGSPERVSRSPASSIRHRARYRGQLPPAERAAPVEAADHFGWFADFAAIDAPASSARTRDKLGWAPTGTGLIADLDRPIYFGT